jgi:hypothetical protein
MELEAKRMEIFREILDEENEDVLAEVIEHIRETRAYAAIPPPLGRSMAEELREAVLQSEEDFKNGRFVTLEYMRALHPRV